MPRVTLAEITATGRKAARGCGCPWGIAEEAGAAARWLEARGMPGVEALAALVSEQETCCTQGGTPCALRLGASLADRAPLLGDDPLDIRAHNHPLLILAQLGHAATATGQSVTLHWGAERATLTPDSPPAQHAASLVADAAWTTLKQRAHKTLVPATEASRAGAGAGTHDRD